METRMRSVINKISRDHMYLFLKHFVKSFFSGNHKWDKFIQLILLFQFLIVSNILMIHYLKFLLEQVLQLIPLFIYRTTFLIT